MLRVEVFRRRILMETYGNGIMGSFNRKVGTAVGCMWNGNHPMRAYKRHVSEIEGNGGRWLAMIAKEKGQMFRYCPLSPFI